MPELEDGEVTHVQGSAATPYELKNLGGVYSCTCPAWRNQSAPLDGRTCKHLKALRGDAAELARIGAVAGAVAARPAAASSGGGGRPPAVKKDTAPPVLLAHPWENDVDLTGWWMSEKLDGFRAYWNGKSFISRAGNMFLAPDWFTHGLPEHPLDGELWMGRKRFQKTSSVVRSGAAGQAWKEVRYVLFDHPSLDAPFEERLAWLCAEFPEGKHPHTYALQQVRCEGLDHVRDELARVEGLGGEGLMMRRPGSRYVAGRSTTLLKVKSFFDAEARVLAHVPGRGRHQGRLGALECELPDGTTFNVGTGFSDKERGAPPALGSVITFRYQELSEDGVPRFPSYVCERIDGTWPPEGGAAPKRAQKSAGHSLRAIVSMPKAAPAPQPAAASAPTPAPAPAIGARRFEFVEGTSSKFWEIAVNGEAHTTTWGKIGASSRTSKTKTFASPAAAQKDADKLIAEKTKKGYVEVGGAPAALEGDEPDALEGDEPDALEGDESAPDVRHAPGARRAPPRTSRPQPTFVASPPKPAPTPPRVADEDEGDEDDEDEDEDDAPAASAPAGARRFEFQEGTSSKFWQIAVQGASHTVTYGRIGTDGQSKTKPFASPAAAQADADKLISEKTKKGYAEV